MNSKTADTLHRIGRFQFNLPPSLVATGRSQSIYLTDVTTIKTPAGGADAYWTGHLASIRARKRPAGTSSTIIRTLELEPGTPAVWYYNSADVTRHLALDAVKSFGDHILLVSREVEAGGESEIERLLKIVIDGYSPAGEKGFVIGFGALSSEPGLNEETRISFADATLPDFEITFDTHTVREPERTDPLQDIEHDKRAFASGGDSIDVLRNQSRVTAGLRGREGWLSLQTSDKKPSLRFSWSYPGVPDKAGEPSIMIVATALVEHRAQLESCWDGMLQSLRPIPFAAGPGK